MADDDMAAADQRLKEIQQRLTGLAFDRRDPKLSKIADDLRTTLSQASAGGSMAGKTLRDEFAVAALAALISHGASKQGADADACAASAYDFADAMIRARRRLSSDLDHQPDFEVEPQALARA